MRDENLPMKLLKMLVLAFGLTVSLGALAEPNADRLRMAEAEEPDPECD